MLMRNYFKMVFWFGVLSVLGSCDEGIDNDAEFARLNDQEIQKYIQDNNLSAIGTGSGLFYQITQSSNGDSIRDGDSVTVHFTARLVNGYVVDSTSRFLDRPDGFLIGASPIVLGLSEGLKLMKEGEKSILLVPSYLGYGSNFSTLTPPNLPPYSTIVYEIEVLEVRSEDDQINTFISTLPFSEPTTVIEDSLLFYRISEGTPNTKPDNGEQLRVAYRGFLLNGTEFDEGLDSSFTFRLGFGEVIQGWDKGFKLMNEGDSALFVIYSKAAYGSTGNNSIPAYAPLAFEVTLVKSEKQQIIEYINAQGLQNDTASTSSGLYYVNTQLGTGATPSATSNVTVKLKGSYIDYSGQLVEFTNQPSITFDLETDNQQGGLTTGLEEGIRLMKQGGKIILMMPSKLAYGEDGNDSAPFVLERAPVIYEVELISVQ
ncbi:MAG: FKBP-type peptidyl-prolyl cis-trans isomerase [Microscillaceae bacterium]|nr:FKBP-type peptidyl-prolyl cis-trans isomerase [Microscillaceae bacterium]